VHPIRWHEFRGFRFIVCGELPVRLVFTALLASYYCLLICGLRGEELGVLYVYDRCATAAAAYHG